MNCLTKEKNFSAVLPKYLRNSLLCFTFVNPGVVDGAPDITICSNNGYLYEVKNKKILQSLNLADDPSSVSCYYLLENENPVIFYLVFTKNLRLLIIRLVHKHLKIVAAYDKIKEFQVFDFKCLGFPQIKITFLNKYESLIFDFPVEHIVKPENNENEDPVVNILMEYLEELNVHVDELTEEYNHLRKISFSNCMQTISEKISVRPIDFSSPSNKGIQQNLKVCFKWIKVFGNSLALGMKLRNSGNEALQDMEFIINHRKINDYAFRLFQSATDVSCSLFSPSQVNKFVKPGDEIFVVGTFEIPTFFSESELSIPCYVTDAKSTHCLVQEIFEVTISDIASQNIVGLEEQFTVEDLLAIKIIKSETRVKIQTEDLEDGYMESLLIKNLGFKKIKHEKEKLLYCTSSYLKEVFIALEHISVNPSVWKLILYTSEHNQIYFLVNALYDFLPDNTVILYDNMIGRHM